MIVRVFTVIWPLISVFDIGALKAKLVEFELFSLVAAFEAVERSAGVLGFRVGLLDAPAHHSVMVQPCLFNVAYVVILYRKVIVAAHFRVFVVELPGQRQLILEVVDGALVVPDRPISHANLLRHPHLLLEEPPRPAIVPQRLVRLNGLIEVAKLDHDVTFCL